MAVTNPATLLSVCQEFPSVNSFASANSATLKNPDFFSGKNKLHLKDWAGYEDVSPAMPKIIFSFYELTSNMRSYIVNLTGELFILVNNSGNGLNLEEFHNYSGDGVFISEVDTSSMFPTMFKKIQMIRLSHLGYNMAEGGYRVILSDVSISINGCELYGEYKNDIVGIPFALVVEYTEDIYIDITFRNTSLEILQ